ncbi:MAG: hypothetical protein JJ975_02150 [Bacteroidia bacterium]|nr:hypothetical protein [Bacteroidia bacterium]
MPQLLLLLAGLISPNSSHAQEAATDFVVFKNGDVISGDVLEMNDSIVVVASSSYGEVRLKRSALKLVELEIPRSQLQKRIRKHDEKPRRVYQPKPVWGSFGFNVSPLGPLGVSGELGSKLPGNRCLVSIKTGVDQLQFYDITVAPLELGFSISPNTNWCTDYFTLHGGRSFKLSEDLPWSYQPGIVYGLHYRHIFASRSTGKNGFYIDAGYQGGRLQRVFVNWHQSIVKRVVQLNQLNVGMGFVF